jgi:hypothetical protein
MPSPKPYNGHHCRNCWNVALWIGNDYGLYQAALECLRRPTPLGRKPSLRIATNRFFADVVPEGSLTPDGARYTATAVRSALAGLES